MGSRGGIKGRGNRGHCTQLLAKRRREGGKRLRRQWRDELGK